jgi:hypothetical protein
MPLLRLRLQRPWLDAIALDVFKENAKWIGIRKILWIIRMLGSCDHFKIWSFLFPRMINNTKIYENETYSVDVTNFNVVLMLNPKQLFMIINPNVRFLLLFLYSMIDENFWLSLDELIHQWVSNLMYLHQTSLQEITLRCILYNLT